MKVYHFSPTLSTPFYPYPHSPAPFSPNSLSTCTLSCPTLFPTVSAALHSPTSLSHSLFYPNNPSFTPLSHPYLSPTSLTPISHSTPLLTDSFTTISPSPVSTLLSHSTVLTIILSHSALLLSSHSLIFSQSPCYYKLYIKPTPLTYFTLPLF